MAAEANMMPAFGAAGNPFLESEKEFREAFQTPAVDDRPMDRAGPLLTPPVTSVPVQGESADSARAPADRPEPARTPLETLVEAERAFSAMSVEKGMRDAFVFYLANDAVLFRPLPLSGKKLWESRGQVPGTLIWEPSYAEVSAAGDLGYTTGPWELRPPPDSTGAVNPDRVGYGHFISVWKKRPDGAWRVAIDIGGSHEKPERGVGSGELVTGPPAEAAGTSATGTPNRMTPAPAASRAQPRIDLAALDRGYSRASASRGIPDAFVDRATPDVRLNREGAFPAVGLAAARAALDTLKGQMTWRAHGQGLSASSDLGYTYGIAELRAFAKDRKPDSSVYLHVWRKVAQGWRLALAVENPLPKR